MADWKTNNRACTTLWITLYTMHQLVTNFADSGILKMKDLTFFNPLSSGDLRRQEAESVADHLDNVFRNARGAIFEDGINRAKAMSAMIDLLSDGEKTVSDLAFSIDAVYKFWEE